MAKGKSSSQKSYTSKGTVGTNKWLRNVRRREYKGSLQEVMNKFEAWKNFKNVVLTVPNPNTNETAKKFIRVNARDVWGSPKRTSSTSS